METLAILELAVPESLEFSLEPGVAHDLTLGVAMQIGTRYFLAARADRDGVVVSEGQTLVLTAELIDGKRGPGSIQLRFLDEQPELLQLQ